LRSVNLARRGPESWRAGLTTKDTKITKKVRLRAARFERRRLGDLGVLGGKIGRCRCAAPEAARLC
jgi:N-methylhydantoinase B/oxoprolinase/acetone carboxylase alpha subunit